MDNFEKFKKKCLPMNSYLKLFISEFIGTLLLLFLGTCSSSQHAIGGQSMSSNGTVWGWGLSVVMAVLVTGGVSGGHVNPAVSLAFFSIGRLKLTELFLYWIAQYAGAFVGTACTYGIYYDALKFNNGVIAKNIGSNNTFYVFITHPQQNIGTPTLFFDQVIGTMVLVILVQAIGDDRNMNVPKGMRPLCIGFAVMCILLSLNHNSGAAINPARDFGPRLLIFASGWGPEVFKIDNYFFWIPLVATHVGAVIGAYVYLLSIEWNLPLESNNQKSIELVNINKLPVILNN